ncbi:MAG: mevalonate kinase family protein, partial [Pseudonocardiaceae bacterium]
SVALVRGLAQLHATRLDRTDLLHMATEVECVFHGRSSGLDICAVMHSGVTWFEPTPVPASASLQIPKQFALVIGLTDERRSTAGPIATLEAARARHVQPIGSVIDRLGALTHQGRTALTGGDTIELGYLMNQAQTALRALGLSTPTLDHAVSMARAAGAAGAKLTGAGGGGAIVALAPQPTAAPRIEAALKAAGLDAFTARLGPLLDAMSHQTDRCHP